MPSAFSHDPAITTPGSSTDNAIVIFDGTGGSGFGNSTILVDSGGNGRIGIAGDTDVIIITANTVTVAGTLAATTLTGAGAGITALTAANITASGTLPALNGAALTALNGTQVTSGTLPAARIGDDSIVEAKLDVSNGPTNGQFLQAQSGEGGGLTWAAAGSQTPWTSNIDSDGYDIVTDDSNKDINIVPHGTGKVGIGTTSPNELLTVNGAIRAQNTVGGWVHTTWIGGTGAMTLTSGSYYNVSAATDNGTGDVTVSWDVDFVTANTYVCGGTSQEGRLTCQVSDTAQAVGSCQFACFVTDSGTRTDSNPVAIFAIGKNFS